MNPVGIAHLHRHAGGPRHVHGELAGLAAENLPGREKNHPLALVGRLAFLPIALLGLLILSRLLLTLSRVLLVRPPLLLRVAVGS